VPNSGFLLTVISRVRYRAEIGKLALCSFFVWRARHFLLGVPPPPQHPQGPVSDGFFFVLIGPGGVSDNKGRRKGSPLFARARGPGRRCHGISFRSVWPGKGTMGPSRKTISVLNQGARFGAQAASGTAGSPEVGQLRRWELPCGPLGRRLGACGLGWCCFLLRPNAAVRGGRRARIQPKWKSKNDPSRFCLLWTLEGE